MAYEKIKEENYDCTGGINDKASEYITGPNQFLDLRNLGFERPGALVSRNGYAQFASLANTAFIEPKSLYQYINSNGQSYAIFDSGPTLFFRSSALPVAMASSLTVGASVGLNVDYETANNLLFFANGYSYQRAENLGAATLFSTYYSLPMGTWWFGNSNLKFATFTTGIDFPNTFIIPSGTFSFKFSFVKTNGGTQILVGQDNGYTVNTGIAGVSLPILHASVGATVAVNAWYLAGLFDVPSGFGINSVIVKMLRPGAVDFISSPEPVQIIGGSELQFEDFTYNTEWDEVRHFTLVPQYIESYKNMLFMAGFSTQPSAVWHSELGQPENVQEENFIDVRTNNGDVITALVPYQDTLIIFKNRSIHELYGDSPNTLSLKDVTFEYGCLNNAAAVVFENKLWFCDEAGICEYNGPDTFVVSQPVESKLNLVDKTKCRAFHIKKRNEVWFCFGSECFVYNYEVGAWTIYDSIPIEYSKGSGMLQLGATTPDLSFFTQGSSFTSLRRFDDNTYTDNGVAITLLARTRYHKRLGDSTQELWRRFYFESDIGGVTTAVTLSFRPDYGSSIYLQRNILSNEFQERIDFGISAKSLSVEMVMKASTRLTINGYTVESRYLRSV